MVGGSNPDDIRLAELVAALSLGIDLGFGQPMEHVLRQCMIALRLGDVVGLSEDERAVVYYTALLVGVGCHTDAHEQAKWFGDDIGLKQGKYEHEFGSFRAGLAMLGMIGSGSPTLHRFRVGLEFLVSGHRDLNGMIEHHGAMTRRLAERLGLPDEVQEAVGSSYEQWDGKGWPGARRGAEIPVAARASQIAEFAEVAHRIGGLDEAVDVVGRRSGSQFDPELAAAFCQHPEKILGPLGEEPTWSTVIESEPALAVSLSEAGFDSALSAVADFVDLKSPYTLGHAKATAALAAAAATKLGAGEEVATLVGRAGLVQGFGRLGVSNAIWDKPGPLGAGEWERVRMHPYITERMLRQAVALSPLGDVAVQLRERLDGSGYPRGIGGGAISLPARVLAAADSYRAMREPRPHRPARSPEDAARELRAEVTAGRLDGDAVEAVLGVAGHEVRKRREGPAGLTPREIDVLRLVARGVSSKDIATRLVISPKTARNHIEHIYTKIGASNRAAAGWFAVQNGLLPEDT